MSVLEKIRNKTGLLVGIIGLALVLFVLQSALSSGGAMFGTSESSIGKIAGSDIGVQDFKMKVDELVSIYQRNGNQVDDQTKQQIVEQAWMQLINEKVIKEEYAKLGITVSEEELTDLMLVHPHSFVQRQFTDPQTGQINPQFAKPDGTLDLNKINTLVQQMQPDQEKSWAALEDQVKDIRSGEKYNALIKKGLYITTAQAKFDHIAQTHSMNVKFVMKRFSSVADSTIQVKDEEIQKYYNEHQYMFKNEETTRKLEYIVWDAVASPEDIQKIKADMASIASDFKTKTTAAEDSSFMQAENEESKIDITSVLPAQISPEIDSTVYTAPNGTVYGPYQENNTIKISKLIGVNSILDSSKVRHILVAYEGSGASQDVKRTKDQAKKLADSLLSTLKKDNKKFAEFVQTYSDDGGKKPQSGKTEWMGKDGNYGWINEMSGFVESFKKFGLNGKKGDLGVVESNYGYHIMEVMDVSKGQQKKYSFATVTRKIEPSDETRRKYFAMATEFSGKNNSKEQFDKAVEEQKLNKRIADNVKEGEKSIAGLDNPKEMVRWAYSANVGDVNKEPFTFGDRYVVAVLSDIKNKGTAALEQVKDDVTLKVKTEKKAEQFIKELNDKMTGTKSVNELAQKMGVQAERSENLLFNSYSVTGLGREDAFCGIAAALKVNAMSKPYKGQAGVFVVEVESGKDTPAKDCKDAKKNSETMLSSRVDYDVAEALKTLANIEDHKAKYDY